MTPPRPRNDGPGHRTISVGERSRGGQVSVWLSRNASSGRLRVGVNAAYLTDLVVHIDLEDAVELRDALTVLLRRAGHGR